MFVCLFVCNDVGAVTCNWVCVKLKIWLCAVIATLCIAVASSDYVTSLPPLSLLLLVCLLVIALVWCVQILPIGIIISQKASDDCLSNYSSPVRDDVTWTTSEKREATRPRSNHSGNAS
jgi:hypothetical protein